jgi:23S rRNA (guanosine2251-2'-O)-methyltransferase
MNLKEYRLLALDGVQNPQNLGMIIRSAAAGNIDGIILPKKNSAKISPLVIKASAGTLFKIPIYYCNALEDVLKKIKIESDIFALSSYAKDDLNSLHVNKKSVFVLGNESEGISNEVQSLCNASVKIPMNRGVESLNVAVTAALISFLPR